jgi:hypothetical protein
VSTALVIDRPHKIRIEALGRARDFVRRVGRDDAAFLDLIKQLWQPIRDRHSRRPGRKLRPETLAITARRWRDEGPAAFRISFAAKVDGAKGTICER